MAKLGRARKILLIAGGSLLLLIATIFFAIGSSPVLNLVANIARQQLQAMQLDLEIGSLSGNPFSELKLERVSLSKDNQLLLSLPQASLKINIWGLLRGDIIIEDAVLHRPLININESALSLTASDPEAQAMGPGLESGGLKLSIPDFTLNNATLNIGLPAYQAYSLERLTIQGSFSMDNGTGYAIDLQQALAYWQRDQQAALIASGQIAINRSSLVFDGLKIALNGNLLNADGQIDWNQEGPVADFKLEAHWSNDLLAGGQLYVPAPVKPLTLNFNIASAGQMWRTELNIQQQESALKLAGTINPKSWNVNLNGQASAFFPQHIYAAMPEAIAGLNLDGDITLAITPASLQLSLGGIYLDKTSFGQLTTDITFSETLLAIKQLELKQSGGNLSLQANLPLPLLSAPSQAEFKLSNFILPGHQLIADDIPAELQGSVLNGQGQLLGDMEKGNLSLNLDIEQTASQPAHLRLAGNWQDRRFTIKQGELNAPWANISLQGGASLESMDLKCDLRITDISPLFAFLPQDLSGFIPRQGGLNGQLKAGGKLEQPLIDYHLFGQNLHGPSIDLNAMELKGSLQTGENLTLQGELDVSLLDVAGMSINSLLLSADINQGQGNISLQALSASGWKAQLQASPKDFALWQVHNISFSGPHDINWQQQGQAGLELADNAIKLENLRLAYQEQTIAADFSMLAGALQGEVNISQFDLGQIGNMPANPRLTFQAGLGGSTDNPEITFTSLMQAQYNQQPITLNLEGGYKSQQASLRAVLQTAEQTWLNLNGSARVPLDGNIGQVQLSARAGQVSLAMLQTFLPQLTRLRGTLDMNIDINGTWPNLNPKGYIKLDNAGFSVSAIAMNFRRFNMLLECSEQGLNISQLSLRTGPAEIEGKGLIAWPWRENATLDASLSARSLAIKLPPWGRITLDADLQLAGNYETPMLDGEIVAKSASAQLFKTSHSDLDEVVTLTSEQTPPPISFDAPEEFSLTIPDFLDSWKVALSLPMDPDFRVNFPQGWFQVGGQVGVAKQPYQAPAYSGRYTIDGGIIVVFGTRIESLSGYVAFNDPDSMFPDLDIQATVRKGFTDIVARVHGSAINPILSLTSDPPMSEADILSMLAFGKPIQELNQEQGASLSGQAAALAVIGEQGRRELQNILGSEITPDVITVHNEMQYGSSIEAGKYLSKDIYLRYRQGTEQTDNRSLGLEWQLSRRISLQGQVGTERDSGVDIIFHFVWYETEEQADSVSEQPEP